MIFIEYAENLEISPIDTMLQEYQHPGYPAIISAIHRIFVSTDDSSLSSNIYAAQAGALFYRLCAVVIIYLIGRELVGAKSSFVAVLILILLPKSAEYGSDALSDWPHMFFLAVGMLLLIRAATNGKWWMFGLAGLAGGLGYLIRPECAQVVIYGLLWLGLQLFRSDRNISRSQVILGITSILVGFIITAGPYMKLTGAFFPKKNVGTFSSSIHSDDTEQQNITFDNFHAGIVPSKIAGAIVKIFENIGDTLMWFFFLPYLIGVFGHFRWHKIFVPNTFFIIALFCMNIALMIWLYCSYGYMSGRHTLPLIVFTIFYIPSGIQTLASLLNTKFSKGEKHTHRWFAILMVIGIIICIPKLVKPLHYDKLIYRRAAQWLSENTQASAVVAVPDSRIGFYAERERIVVEDDNIPDTTQYIVKLISDNDSEQEIKLQQQFQKVFSTEQDNNKNEIVIYQRIGN